MSKQTKRAKKAKIKQLIPAVSGTRAVFARTEGNVSAVVHAWALCDDGKVRALVPDDDKPGLVFADRCATALGFLPNYV